MGPRLFLGIPTPEPVRRAVAGWIRERRAAAPGWRWVDPARMHLTLRFYGETAPELVESLAEDLREIACGEAPFALGARGWGVFPGASRPRILWVGLSGRTEPLARLARAAEAAARRRGFAPEERAFHPHLTIARAARDSRPALPGRPDPELPDFGEYGVGELVLFRSHLRPEGPLYEPLARSSLSRETEE